MELPTILLPHHGNNDNTVGPSQKKGSWQSVITFSVRALKLSTVRPQHTSNQPSQQDVQRRDSPQAFTSFAEI